MVNAMCAVITFCGGVCVGINIECVIGASLHTSLASNATPIVKVDDSVVPGVKSGDRTDCHAGCIVTMIAPHDRKQSTRVWELALLDILHPSSVDSDRDAVFAFAGNRAGVTANTATVVDDKSVVGHARLCFQRLKKVA